MIKVKINGKVFDAQENETVLDVCNKIGIKIPTLCYLKEFGAISSCRVCLVKVKGQKNLVTACSFKVFDSIEIETDTKEVIEARKTNIELLLSNHNYDCKNCVRDGVCELQTYAKLYKADADRFKGEKNNFVFDSSNPALIRDNSKCILCKKCVNVCSKRQTVDAISEVNRGFKTQIVCAFNKSLESSSCVGCGQCVSVCPTGALTENFSIKEVEKAIKDKTKHVVVAPAPSVRASLREEFGNVFDDRFEAVLPTLLREIGFDKVFDINFAADLTVVEEGEEFLERLKANKNLPLITSCCPGWVDFAKKFFPEFLNNISSTKSPQEMFGAVVKSYYAEMSGINPNDIVVVSIMPCTAKKKELTLNTNKIKDVDFSLTIRELAYLIRKNKIDVKNLKESNFDKLLGYSSGAGVIFGSSGGVMEAALRTVVDKLSGKEINNIDYEAVRGFKGTKFASLNIVGKTINVAVVSALNNARKLLNEVKAGKLKLDFIEIMACPGGCINGGGNPYKTADEINYSDYKEKRAGNLYFIDKSRVVRKSHLNPELIAFYDYQKKAKTKTKLHVEHKR